MVKQIKKGDKVYYQCEICKFTYETKEWADKCENWCKEHNSCNIEITKHAVNIDNEK